MQIGARRRRSARIPTAVQDFAEVIADAKARPGKVNVGVLGASQALVLMTLIKKENGVDLNLIPYKGGGPLNQDILRSHGRRHRQPDLVQPARPCQQSPGARRDWREAHPGAARHADPHRAGREGLPVLFWWGVYRADRHAAPDRRPHACRDQEGRVLAPDVTQKFIDQFNMENPDDLARGVRGLPESEQERWFKVIKDNDIKGD